MAHAAVTGASWYAADRLTPSSSAASSTLIVGGSWLSVTLVRVAIGVLLGTNSTI
jgi:hypothetical protein